MPKKQPGGGNERKSNAGRKSKYHTHIQPYLEHIAQMRRNGATLDQIGEMFKVSHDAINQYQHKFPEFKEVLKLNAEVAVLAVENALFKNAVDHNNLAAQIFFLKNRASSKWRDRQHIFQQSTQTVRKDYDNMTDEELENEFDTLKDVVGEEEQDDSFEQDGELH